jgi:hypothetical protein
MRNRAPIATCRAARISAACLLGGHSGTLAQTTVPDRRGVGVDAGAGAACSQLVGAGG